MADSRQLDPIRVAYPEVIISIMNREYNAARGLLAGVHADTAFTAPETAADNPQYLQHSGAMYHLGALVLTQANDPTYLGEQANYQASHDKLTRELDERADAITKTAQATEPDQPEKSQQLFDAAAVVRGLRTLLNARRESSQQARLVIALGNPPELARQIQATLQSFGDLYTELSQNHLASPLLKHEVATLALRHSLMLPEDGQQRLWLAQVNLFRQIEPNNTLRDFGVLMKEQRMSYRITSQDHPNRAAGAILHLP